MSKLVENLLALARGDNQGVAAKLVPVDLTGLLCELCAEPAPAAQAKGLELISTIPDEELYAMGEATDLRRLFLILIDNAIKYTEPGSINLSVNSKNSHVSVTFRDTEIGIEQGALPHVFDRSPSSRSSPGPFASIKPSKPTDTSRATSI